MSDRRFRVLAVASHPVQYMTPVFRRMANHPRLDLQVVYCSLRGAEATHDSDFDTMIQWDIPLLTGYSWVEVPNQGWANESFFGRYNPGLWHLIRRGNFDAVLCYTGYVCASFWIALAAAKLSQSAFLFGTDAISLVPRDRKQWKAFLKKVMWPHLYSLADQVIVPSSGTRDLMRSLGLADDRITLTPYSVENDWWISQAARVDRAAIRSSWGANPDTTIVLFCAKLQPWKRPFDLLFAFAKASATNTLLIFAGAGPLSKSLQLAAARLGIAARVRFLGFVNQSQLPSIYSAADLMVLPSEYEPFAVVVNEACCCGCPVITSDQVGAARDLIAPVNPTFVFPAGDVTALTTLLNKTLNKNSMLACFGRKAKTHMDSWSPQQNVEATIHAIEIAVERIRRSDQLTH
jgi:glycosyltransferase involved in cell wall biosynthesis